MTILSRLLKAVDAPDACSTLEDALNWAEVQGALLAEARHELVDLRKEVLDLRWKLELVRNDPSVMAFASRLLDLPLAALEADRRRVIEGDRLQTFAGLTPADRDARP